MADTDRPRTSLTTKAIVVAVVALGAWIVLRLTFATVRAAFALAGYVIVAFLAYQFGKWVGHHSGPDDEDS